MADFVFEKLLTNSGWMSNVAIKTDNKGTITDIQENALKGESLFIEGITLPGFQNGHSHAFQYAMAGLAEVHNPNALSDNFWSWRNAMYDLALRISPDDLEAIASALYAEMLVHGYTNVAEFHYVHHDVNGQPYENLSEMGERLVAAAQKTGINITLIPIFYQKGGFGKAATEGQRRFLSKNEEGYYRLLDASHKSARLYDGANIAVGIHSMRGVEPEAIFKVAQEGPQDLPFHIHISEQLQEIEDSLNYLGKRPVEWFLENIPLDSRYHLVHATHLTREETEGLAKSKANVVLCPTTEGNLGDGIFPLNPYNQLAGNWSIGTDSHVSLNPLEELRLLDYGQRLTSHSRLTFAGTSGDSGFTAIEMITKSGRCAMNNDSEIFFKVGEPLNAVNYSLNNPLLAVSGDPFLLSTLVYSSDSRANCTTIVRGTVLVKNGKHVNDDTIKRDFATAIKGLKTRF